MNAREKPAIDVSRLRRAGVFDPSQLLLWLPTKYKDYRTFSTTIEETLVPKDRQVLRLTAVSKMVKASSSPPRFTMTVTDGIRNVRLTLFGMDFEWRDIKEGTEFAIEGHVETYRGELGVVASARIPLDWLGRVIPMYQGVRGVISKEAVASMTEAALDIHLADITKFIVRHFPGLPDESAVRAAAGIQYPIASLLRVAHRPRSVVQAENARTELGRLAAFELVYKARISQARSPNPKSALDVRDQDVAELIRALPFPITQDQATAIQSIVAALRSPLPMNALLSGDVATGKTLAFLIPAIAARMRGAKVAILTPSLLLVSQLAREIRQFFCSKGFDVPVIEATSGVSVGRKDLECCPIVVGTTAMISRLAKAKWIPDFLICDEQQKFSREQRETLMGAHTNFLEATATCVPRTAALVTHGGMDLFTLKETPIKRSVATRLVGIQDRERLFKHIGRVVEAGGQVAIIYPRVADDGDVRSSVMAAATSWERQFPGKVATLHGKMTDDEKVGVITGMRSRQFDILVSSTVIEVGVTLPSLKSVVVADADRYGTSTLHQLRGRVARGGGSGYFFMLSGADVEQDTIDRLRLLEQFADGFSLAEHDMRQRGFGDLAGDDQAGASQSMFRGVQLLPEDIERYLGSAASH